MPTGSRAGCLTRLHRRRTWARAAEPRGAGPCPAAVLDQVQDARRRRRRAQAAGARGGEEVPDGRHPTLRRVREALLSKGRGRPAGEGEPRQGQGQGVRNDRTARGPRRHNIQRRGRRAQPDPHSGDDDRWDRGRPDGAGHRPLRKGHPPVRGRACAAYINS